MGCFGFNLVTFHCLPRFYAAAIFSGMEALIGMGRVNEYADAGDGEEPCEARQDQKDGLTKIYSSPYAAGTFQIQVTTNIYIYYC